MLGGFRFNKVEESLVIVQFFGPMVNMALQPLHGIGFAGLAAEGIILVYHVITVRADAGVH